MKPTLAALMALGVLALAPAGAQTHREALERNARATLAMPAKPDDVGKCILWDHASILVSAESDERFFDDLVRGLPEPGPELNFFTNGRWNTTATDGPVFFGQAFTLTYSFVPDGTSIPSGIGEPAGVSNLVALMDANYPGGMTAFRAKVGQAFARWGELTGITYVEVSDDGAAFFGSVGVLGTRGDLRIGAKSIDGATGSNTLAYNFFPEGGDMVMDSDNIATWTNSTDDFIRLRNVIAHEHGHGFGYLHVEPRNLTKLMEPILAVNFDGPQEDDIRGAQFQYGDNSEANGTFLEATPLGDLTSTFTLENLAVESRGEFDFYRFTMPDNRQLNVTLEPVGTTYPEHPQNQAAQQVNVEAASILDLSMTVFGVDETDILGAANSTGLGGTENLSIPVFDGNSVVIRVTGNRTPAIAKDIQRYRLVVTLGGAAGSTPTPSPSPSPSPTPIPGVNCQQPDLDIPDGDGFGASTDIIVTETGTIGDLNVTLNISHAFVGDIIARLEHVETGTVVTLLDRPGVPASQFGCNLPDVAVTFDDDAANAAEDTCGTPIAISGTLRPASSLASFNGQSYAGTWRLTVSDPVTPDAGTVTEWCLNATLSGGETPTATATPAPTATPSASPSPSPSATVAPSASPSPSATVAPTSSPSPSPSATPAPTASPSASPAPSASPTEPPATPTATPAGGGNTWELRNGSTRR